MAETQSTRRVTTSYRLYSFLIFFAFILGALVLVGFLSYQQNRAFFRDFVRETNRAYVEETARLLDRIFYQVSFTSAAFADTHEVLSYVTGVGVDDLLTIENELQSLLVFLVNSSQNVSSAYVYSKPRKRIVSALTGSPLEQVHDSSWVGELERQSGQVAALLSRRSDRFDEHLISILRRIDDGEGLAGGIIVNMPLDGLRRAVGYTRHHIKDDFLIVDGSGSVIFSFRDERIGRPLDVSADSSFIQSADGAFFNLRYVSVRGKDAFEERLWQLRRYLVLLIVVVSLSGSAIAFFLAGFAYRPIREIVDTIENPDRAHRSIPGEDIRFIEDTIVQFMASNSELEARLAERFEGLRRANYVALQLQMNPHFLYNTLDSLYWNCLEAYPEDAPVPASLASLSRLLRLLLDTEEMAIPLAEEIHLTNQYVRLLEIRFRGAFTVTWDVPEEIRSHLVPKLLLQPLVENAYYHGIKPLRRPGTIAISARRTAGAIELRVSDDGRGVAPAELAAVRERLEADVSLSGEKIGVHNVAKRLRILFGEDARISIASDPGRGTVVVVRVPNAAPSLKIG